jgi:hypothetical protein
MFKPRRGYWGFWGGGGLLLAVTGCSGAGDRSDESATYIPGASATSDGADEAGGEALAPGGYAPGPVGSGTSADAPATGVAPIIAPPDDTSDPVYVPPGTLTAGVWDDNQNLDRFLDYRTQIYANPDPALLAFTASEHEAAFGAHGQLAAKATLDVSLVIDATGSMGDELTYLQTEFDELARQIETKYPAAEQRWSLIVYRDRGDDYTARTFDFESDVSKFRTSLAQQSAGGGGDYPEASDAALEAMNQLTWRSGANTARLAFWVADAPHHAEYKDELRQAILAAQGQGIHLYPVASSGVDELTEISLRAAAQLTGGRYLFLTNDSGVGNDHKEPSIPCYFVTKLSAAILRMVDIEMTGSYREPTNAEVIRARGAPQGGACTLSSGETVFAF